MEFKIDTKSTYSVVTPMSNILDANLTATLRHKWKELTESGSHNLIVDLQQCISIAEGGINSLVSLHEEVYATHQSLVVTNLQNEPLAAFKKNEADLLINFAPTMQEAVDIISMEILERELFDEES